jgi:hypothetical protein
MSRFSRKCQCETHRRYGGLPGWLEDIHKEKDEWKMIGTIPICCHISQMYESETHAGPVGGD